MINLHKIGENTTHNKDFFVDRPNGHPVYLLLLIKTPSLFLSGDEWQRIPADCAVIFRPVKHTATGQITPTIPTAGFISLPP